MKDADYKKQKARLVALRKRWHDALGLNWWHVTYNYTDGDFEVDGEQSKDTLASCHTDWRYLRATINWNMPRVALSDDATLEMAYVHEVMHIYANELREGVREGFDHLVHEERACTQLARVSVWVREAGERDALSKKKKADA